MRCGFDSLWRAPPVAQDRGGSGGAGDGGPQGRHKVVVFARSRQGVRSILEGLAADSELQEHFRPLRLVGKGSGGEFMSLREQVGRVGLARIRAQPPALGRVDSRARRLTPAVRASAREPHAEIVAGA